MADPAVPHRPLPLPAPPAPCVAMTQLIPPASVAPGWPIPIIGFRLASMAVFMIVVDLGHRRPNSHHDHEATQTAR
jgi:hypothetical protein